MSVESAITKEMGWHRYESKFIRIPITDDADAPVDMDTIVGLRWLLLNETGGTILLTKLRSDAQITIEDDVNDNIVRVEIETPGDYEDVPAGWYYHELWDDDNHVLLSYGDAYLGEGAPPPE